MSKILRRPMFRGGPVSSYGNGIATGLADGGRVGYQVGGPIYPAGYSAVPDGGITGADIKKMAEKKVFMSGFGKDTAQLNSTLKDLYMNYIQSPLEKGGNRFIDYMQNNAAGLIPEYYSNSQEDMYPEEKIEGVGLVEEKEIDTENGKRIVMTFDGEKSFTLIQERAKVSEVGTTTTVSGEPVDLGFTVGSLTENSITWSYQGVDFMIASEDLTQEEMYSIAHSVQGQAIK